MYLRRRESCCTTATAAGERTCEGNRPASTTVLQEGEGECASSARAAIPLSPWCRIKRGIFKRGVIETSAHPRRRAAPVPQDPPRCRAGHRGLLTRGNLRGAETPGRRPRVAQQRPRGRGRLREQPRPRRTHPQTPPREAAEKRGSAGSARATGPPGRSPRPLWTPQQQPRPAPASALREVSRGEERSCPPGDGLRGTRAGWGASGG